MAIEILVTGGTFDKEYNELNGTLFFKETHLPEMLNIARCKLGVKIKTAMLADSLEMTDGDRELILSHCKKIWRGQNHNNSWNGQDGRNRPDPWKEHKR
jgi:hypothetical protein